MLKNEPPGRFPMTVALRFCSRVKGLFVNWLRTFWRDESGATAIEYSLIVASIAVAIISDVNGLGTKLGAKLTLFNTNLK